MFMERNMLIVYKEDTERDAKAEIVKYTDRIWFNEDGDANYLQSMIIHVLDDSPKPLSQLFFLLPAPKDHVRDVKDASETCLDDQFVFNSFKTLGYRIKTKDENGGTIFNDGFDNVTVRYGNTLDEPLIIGNTTCISVKFNGDIQSGEFREIRLRFLISGLATSRRTAYTVDLSYFGDYTVEADYKVAVNSVKGHAQIPVIAIYDKDTKQGGFDVILYLPPDMEGRDFPALARKSIDTHTEDGSEGDEREKYIWHLREATDAREATFGLRISITGRWSYEIRPVIVWLFDEVTKSSRIGIVALILAVVSLIVALVIVLVP